LFFNEKDKIIFEKTEKMDGELLDQFIGITGASKDVAEQFLEASKGDLDVMNHFFYLVCWKNKIWAIKQKK